LRSGEGKLPAQFLPLPKKDSSAFRVQGKMTRLQPAATFTGKQGKETLQRAGQREGERRWAQKVPIGTKWLNSRDI